MIKNILIALILGGTLFSQAAFSAEKIKVPFVDETTYLETQAPIQTAHQKSVTELFSYFCPHCYHLEKPLEKWLASKPKDIHFQQMPAVFNNPRWVFFARVFYTQKELGILEKSHVAFFDALHRDRKPLFSLKPVAKFFTKYGVTEKQFTDMFKSFKVDGDVKKAMAFTQAAGIDGVPAIIVNGKYRTDVGLAGSTQKLWPLVESLVNK